MLQMWSGRLQAWELKQPGIHLKRAGEERHSTKLS